VVGSACSCVSEGAEAKGLSQRSCDVDTITGGQYRFSTVCGKPVHASIRVAGEVLPREEESRKNGDSKGASTGLGDDSKEKKSDGREERRKIVSSLCEMYSL